MDRKTTIKILRDITRKLQDDSLFEDFDFDKIADVSLSSDFPYSRVEQYIKNKLKI